MLFLGSVRIKKTAFSTCVMDVGGWVRKTDPTGSDRLPFGLSLSPQEQYIFIHQCVQLMWLKKKKQFCISDVIYENVSKS